MPNPIPPPGPERDTEIVLALGGAWVTLPDPIDGGTIRRIRLPDDSMLGELPPYSTDPAACDRLERELADRGFQVLTNRWASTSIYPGQVDASVTPGHNSDRASVHTGTTRPDAVSAAALLALRGAR